MKEMHQWMPKEQLKKWKRYADYNWQSMSLEQVRALIALKEQNDSDRWKRRGTAAGTENIPDQTESSASWNIPGGETQKQNGRIWSGGPGRIPQG